MTNHDENYGEKMQRGRAQCQKDAVTGYGLGESKVSDGAANMTLRLTHLRVAAITHSIRSGMYRASKIGVAPSGPITVKP